MKHGEQGTTSGAKHKRKQDADQKSGLSEEKTWR